MINDALCCAHKFGINQRVAASFLASGEQCNICNGKRNANLTHGMICAQRLVSR